MSEQNKDDELAGTEQPFVAHLVELRDRMIKAVLAIIAVAIVLAFYPGPGALYDLLAAPLSSKPDSDAQWLPPSKGKENAGRPWD